MLEQKPRIIFMGTADFALPALQKLLASNFSISAVFCQPDQPQGRGLKCTCCAVKKEALKNKLPIFQPARLNDPKIIQKITTLQPAVIVIAAYGLLIPQEILAIPAKGCLNLHPSLLPQYRGPSPIRASILNGDKKTGVSLMLLDEKIDHGPLLAQAEVKIGAADNYLNLNKKLAKLGGEILVKALPLYLKGEIQPKPQDEARASFTRLIKKEDGKINWQNQAARIAREIRAYLGWPGSFTFWQDKRIIILEGSARDHDCYRENVGAVFSIEGGLYVQCGEGILQIKRLQLAGRQAISGAEFLNGYPQIISVVLS